MPPRSSGLKHGKLKALVATAFPLEPGHRQRDVPIWCATPFAALRNRRVFSLQRVRYVVSCESTARPKEDFLFPPGPRDETDRMPGLWSTAVHRGELEPVLAIPRPAL